MSLKSCQTTVGYLRDKSASIAPLRTSCLAGHSLQLWDHWLVVSLGNGNRTFRYYESCFWGRGEVHRFFLLPSLEFTHVIWISVIVIFTSKPSVWLFMTSTFFCGHLFFVFVFISPEYIRQLLNEISVWQLAESLFPFLLICLANSTLSAESCSFGSLFLYFFLDPGPSPLPCLVCSRQEIPRNSPWWPRTFLWSVYLLSTPGSYYVLSKVVRLLITLGRQNKEVNPL